MWNCAACCATTRCGCCPSSIARRPSPETIVLRDASMTKIVRVGVTSLEHVVTGGKAYGNARGLNSRRTCSLIAVETDGGQVGYGDAAGPVGVVREYVKL